MPGGRERAEIDRLPFRDLPFDESCKKVLYVGLNSGERADQKTWELWAYKWWLRYEKELEFKECVGVMFLAVLWVSMGLQGVW